mmetsp:Transcript_5989/g.21108  ORF Transcript_5989/g.21108 Transcript_5989/m.21108 type:complete len:208 (+) Transcript_5989:173-796(+)
MKWERSVETNAPTWDTIPGVPGTNIFLQINRARLQGRANRKALRLDPKSFATMGIAQKMKTRTSDIQTPVCYFLQSRERAEYTAVIHLLQKSLQPVQRGRPSHHHRRHHPLQRHLHPSLLRLQGKVIPRPIFPPGIALPDGRGRFCQEYFPILQHLRGTHRHPDLLRTFPWKLWGLGWKGWAAFLLWLQGCLLHLLATAQHLHHASA